jgi:hypothetical protein
MVYNKYSKAIGLVIPVLVSIITIAAGLIAFYEFVIKLGPPEIDVRFALNNAYEISIAPTVLSSRSEWTEPFPLGLQITNNGESVAKDVHISLISARNLNLVASDVEIKPKLIFSKEGVDFVSHVIRFESINPGQTIHLDNSIYGTTENFVDMEVDVTFRDGVTAILPISIVLTHEIRVLVSASNMSEHEVLLRLTLGALERIVNKGHDVFQYKNNKLVKYK